MFSSGMKLTFVPFRFEVSSTSESIFSSPNSNSANLIWLSLTDSTLK